MPPLLDTNVVLRHLLQDHPSHSARALALFRRISAGEVTARLTSTVIIETVFTLERAYKRPREQIRMAIYELLDEPNLLLAGKARWRRVLDLYVGYNLPLGDAEQVEMMQRLGITEIISFDTDFDRVPGITRIEP